MINHSVSVTRRQLSFAILAILMASFLYIGVRTGFSQQPVLPGNAPADTRERAIEAARFVAINNQSSVATAAPQLQSATNINTEDLRNMLKSAEISMSDFDELGANDQVRFWSVLFTGSFSPKRVPMGIVPPVYSLIEVTIDSRDGSVIFLNMRN